jgi:hypothetical protein
MFPQKTQQFLALHHGHARVFEEFGGDFVSGSRQGCAQAENFFRNCDMECKALTRLRSYRQLRLALTQHENIACGLPFAKQNGIPPAGDGGLDGIECFQRLRWQVTEDPVRA